MGRIQLVRPVKLAHAHYTRAMTDLFEAGGLEEDAPRPLADRLRPKSLADVVGQDYLIGPEAGLIGRHDRREPAALHHPLGPAGHGQDDDRQAAFDGV